MIRVETPLEEDGPRDTADIQHPGSYHTSRPML
jgi:hypothetical protein